MPGAGADLGGVADRPALGCGRGGRALLRGVVLGYVALASFCLVLACALRAWPVGLACGGAAACALVVQLSMKRFGRAAFAPARA